MYYGYCFPTRDGWHTPKVVLSDPASVIMYCSLQHRFFEEIRITDAMDCLVVHVVNHSCKVPQPDGSFKYFDLNRSMQETTDQDKIF